MAAQCNLIIDSCCDLPLSMLQIEGVDTLNFNYVMSDGDHEDDFYQSITPHEFYEKIRNGETPSTSQASPAATEAAWRRAAESGIPTVYLCFSSALSSNYSTAAALLTQVKEEFPDAPLYLVDLMIGSTPEGLLVLEALRQRDSGLSAEELVEWAEQARYFMQTAFMVDDLDALHRGGRIPASVAAAGSALNVKPLLTFDTSGHLALTGAARGRKKGLKQMAEFFAKEHDTQGGSPSCLSATPTVRKTPKRCETFWPNKTRASPWCSTTLAPLLAATLDLVWYRFRSGAATAAKTCPSPTASPRKSSAASNPNGRFGAARHQDALRPRLTTVISPTSEPLFSQLPVAANRSRLVLHAYEQAFYAPSLSLLAPCLSSSSPQVSVGAKALARISRPCKAHLPVSYVCRGSVAPR